MAGEPETKVKIHCSVIPDGLATADGSTLRLSLVLTPDKRTEATGPEVGLQSWPSHISDLIKNKLVIGVQPIDGKSVYLHAPDVAVDPATLPHHGEATKLWRNIFSKPVDRKPFDDLLQALSENHPSGDRIEEVALRNNIHSRSTPDDGALKSVRAFFQKDAVVKFHRYNIAAPETRFVQTWFLDEALNGLHDNFLRLRFAGLLLARELQLAAAGSSIINPADLAIRLESYGRGLLHDRGVASVAAAMLARPFNERLLASQQDLLLRFLLREEGLGLGSADAFGSLEHVGRLLQPQARQSGLAADQQHFFLRAVLASENRLPPSPTRPVQPEFDAFVQPAGTGTLAASTLLKHLAARRFGNLSSDDTTSLQKLATGGAKNFEAFQQHWRNSPVGLDHPALQTKAKDEAKEDAARRKFLAIRAQPALAKFLRLIVDVEIPLEKLKIKVKEKDKDNKDVEVTKLPSIGLVAACFVGTPSDDAANAKTFADEPGCPEWSAYRVKLPVVQASTAGAGAARKRGVAIVEPGHFQPCGQGEFGSLAPAAAPIASPRIKNGVVNLAARYGGNLRFGIKVLDVPAAMNSMRMKAEQDSGAERDGTLPDSISSRLPDRVPRGLQLYDQGLPADTSVALYRHKMQKALERTIKYAEDLTMGYRPYVQRFRPGVEDTPKVLPPWRSLVARHVRIEELAKIIARNSLQHLPAQWHPYPRFKARDHGSVRVVQKIQKKKDPEKPDTPKDVVSVDQQMFNWMGDSLALSTDLSTKVDKDQVLNYAGEDPDKDLVLGTEYSFSESEDDKLAVLRVKHRYLMGLAPVYLNGGGPSLAEVTHAFNGRGNDLVVLGDGSSGDPPTPFRYGPPRDMPPPEVLISDADFREWKKAETAHHAKPATRGNAESLERVVLRTTASGKHSKDVVRRYIAPPRTSFERAEQAGLFDIVLHQPIPHGAFGEYELHDKFGSFPTGDDNKASRAGSPPEQRSRTTILRLRGGHHQPENPYYPDPLARSLLVAFNRNGAIPDGFPEEQPERAFWKQGESPLKAQPIELLIKRWGTGDLGGRFDGDDSKGSITGRNGASSRSIARLTVELAPAEDVELLVWCGPDPIELIASRTDIHLLLTPLISALAEQFRASKEPSFNKTSFGTFVEDYVADLARGRSPRDTTRSLLDKERMLAIDAAIQRLWSALLSRTPDNGFSGWTRFQLVHAVEKPLAVPRIPYVKLQPRGKPVLMLHPVRLRRNIAWQEFAKGLRPADPLAALNLRSEREGTTAYFVGQVEIDRASTKELRIEASWPDLNPASAITQDPKSRHYKFKPLRRDRPLFAVSDISRDRGLSPRDRADVTFSETGTLRGLSFPFGDTGARELSIRVVATSRFDGDFPAAPGQPVPEKDALGRFDVESRPPIGAKRAKDGDPAVYQTYTVMMCATAAPAIPTISRIDWIMPEKLVAFERGRRVCIEKHYHPRLYLGSDWLSASSGEHELLALICAPGNLASERPYVPSSESPPALDPIKLSDDEIKTAPAHRDLRAFRFMKDQDFFQHSEWVCRWGTDPTTTSGPLTGFITRERFSGFVASKSNFKLSEGLSVTLLLYKPKFDEITGEFYVDVGIDPASAYAPMVRLVCARYQPYVIDPALHLSALKRLDPFQVAPPRQAEVLVNEAGVLRTIVQGVGYTNRSPEIPQRLQTEYAESSKVRYPLQSIKVISLDGQHAGSGLQVHDRRGAPLLDGSIVPQPTHPHMLWISREFELPRSPSHHHYGVEINEYDLHFPDEAFETGMVGDVVQRPGKFSLTIDLENGLYVPTQPPIDSSG